MQGGGPRSSEIIINKSKQTRRPDRTMQTTEEKKISPTSRDFKRRDLKRNHSRNAAEQRKHRAEGKCLPVRHARLGLIKSLQRLN